MGYKQLTITTDAAGDGTATTTEYIEGEIMHISIAYVGAAGGTNVVIDQTIPPIPILTVVGNVNGIWNPRAPIVDQIATPMFYDAGGAPPEQVVDRIYVCGPVTATVAAGGIGSLIIVTIVYKDYPSD